MHEWVVLHRLLKVFALFYGNKVDFPNVAVRIVELRDASEIGDPSLLVLNFQDFIILFALL